MGEYTRVEYNVFVCDDCGAHAEDPREVKHHPTCNPGESRHWEEFYSEANEEES